MTPSRAETLVGLAEVHLKRGHAEQAVSEAREADEFWQAFRPSDPEAEEAAIWHGRALVDAGRATAGQTVLHRGQGARPPK